MTSSTIPADLPAGSRSDTTFASRLREAGDLGALVQGMEWEKTPLGPMNTWPQSLKTVVRIVLTSRYSMWMGWGPQLSFLYNEAYARDTLGSKHPWAMGQPASTVWAEIWNDIGPRVQNVLETGVATWDENLMLFLHRSGYTEETYHTFSYSPLTDDADAIAGLLCVVTEVTERVISDRRLKSLRDVAAALAEKISEHGALCAATEALATNDKDLPFTLIYLFDEDGTGATLGGCTGVTPQHAAVPTRIALQGESFWPVERIIGGEPRILVDLDGAPQQFSRGAWSVPPRYALVVPIAKAGSGRPAGFFVAGLSPHRHRDEAYDGFVELIAGQIAASITNARAYDAERQRAESLAQLDRTKTAFFSNVSHEFRTPLTLMLSPTAELLAHGPLEGTDRDQLLLVHRNGLRLLRLVNALLDFSRIEAGRVEAAYEATDVGQFTLDIAASFRSAVEHAGVALDLRASPIGADVFVDREMWEKIVLNLVSNAFKHTFDGTITVSVAEEDSNVVLRVADTGVGVPAEQLARLFERFHRVPNARSRTHEGSGIGLALVQELVRQHGGSIGVESVENVGTTFTVRVPTGSAHLPADRLVVRERGSDTGLTAAFVDDVRRWLPRDDATECIDTGEFSAVPGGARTTAARILLADDNADMREYLTRLLRANGWNVEAVGDGHVALDAARRQPPDLVLTDVMMPGLDGFELLEAMRADATLRTVPVFMLSARAGEESRIEGLNAGADDYLVKPFSSRELIARIAAHLSLAAVRARANSEVSAAHAKLSNLFRQAPAFICVLRGPDHVFEMANDEYVELFGVRDLIGRPLRDAMPAAVTQGLIALLDGVLATGERYVGEERPVEVRHTAAGAHELRYLSFVYQPIAEADGTFTGVFVHGIDVTAHVEARAQLEQARSAAEAANRAKSDFLAAMSHELRTPLNAIAGYAQLLATGIYGEIDPMQRQALERIQRSEEHLLSVINDVLNFAKIEAGRIEYHMKEIDVAEVLERVQPMFEPQLKTRGLSYESRVDRPLHVRADREKVQQILLNLFSNAIKFTDTGGSITVTTSATPSDVCVSIMDTGIGIPVERQSAVFDPFVQVHRNLTRTVEGTGLGLAISRDLARGMGGDLTLESEEGRGSTFTLRLPAL